MKHLKPVQVLTSKAIYLLERVKIHLEIYNNVLPSDSTKSILVELEELIIEIKS